MGSFKKGDKLDATKLKRVKFSLPELGDGVFIWLRALSHAELDGILKDGKADDPNSKTLADHALLAKCCVDDDGLPIFTDADDVKANLDVSLESFVGMALKIGEISGLNKDRSKN